MRILFLFFILSITCCQNNHNPLLKDQFTFYPNNPDSVLYDPEWKKNRLKDYKFFRLPSLLNGTDSFEMRIWAWEAFDLHRRVLVFKVDSLGWTGNNYYSYTKHLLSQDDNALYPPDPKKLGANVFIVKSIEPGCGWNQFEDSLDKYQIKNLPTEGDIKDYQSRGFLDGHGYVIEIATKNSYRILYKLPEICEYEECKKLIAFLEMLKREFGTGYCWPNCWVKGQGNPLEQTK